MNRALAIGGLIVVAAAGATWAGLHVLGDGPAPRSGGPAISKAVPDAIGAPSPAATGGKYCCRCASVPKSEIAPLPRPCIANEKSASPER